MSALANIGLADASLRRQCEALAIYRFVEKKQKLGIESRPFRLLGECQATTLSRQVVICRHGYAGLHLVQVKWGRGLLHD